MSTIAIQAANLSKKYEITVGKYRHDTLRDQISDAIRSAFHSNGRNHQQTKTFWALKEVSFEVKHGEVLGVIGANGAGKSTLLKILSRITKPTSGKAEIHGRVGSLLEVGTGFHGELTGRENIYLNGAILGMKKAEIDGKFDEIVDFSGIETFIDTPVKRYSTGMFVRLAFAVAAHLEPEILIVDEVLAVGDADFQKKCLGKLSNVAHEGRTILFVSHNMAAITALCGRVLWIKGGQLRLSGSPRDVVTSYLTSDVTAVATWNNSAFKLSDDVDFQFTSASVLSMNNEPAAVVDFDKGFRAEIGYELYRAIKGLHVVYQVLNSRGEVVWSTFDTDRNGRNRESSRESGRYLSTCRVPGFLLRPGRYTLSIGAATAERRMAAHENVLSFDVSPVGFHFNENRQGAITPLLDWKVTRLN
jgi:homopolymeric O-antigen transport system ATP-binding protein